MAVNPQFLAATASVDQSAIAPFPNSEKVYIAGSRPDIRVPFRKITQEDTPSQMGAEKNPPLYVYDTSGPYTDPCVAIDIRAGLTPIRAAWINERNDTELLTGPSSAFGQTRLNDPKLVALRFNLHRQPRRAKAGKNVTQMHYAPKASSRPRWNTSQFGKTCCVAITLRA